MQLTMKQEWQSWQHLVMLKNPHNIPAKKFGLKSEMKRRALKCNSSCGPCFGGGDYCDICVSNNCNASCHSRTYHFGCCYTHDTELNGKIVLAGSEYFQVKDIEVFEITH
jgi:hypothetical protein